jgi:chemotaxis protein MotB
VIYFRHCVGLALAASLSAIGCQWVPQNKFDACQAQNRTLTEQTKAQLAEIQNLKVHSRTVEDQLIKAEEDLARLDSDNGRDRQKLANLSRERQSLQQFSGTPGVNLPPGVNGRLADLARRFASLQYDPQTGISKLDTDVLFDSGDAALKPGAERLLVEFADILHSPEARDLKIMVVGHTDSQLIKGREVRSKFPDNWHLSAGRAMAVSDRLRKAGIPENRIGVAGFGQHQPISTNDTADARQKNRRVEIFVIGPETPVVGWTETHGTVYR